MADQQDISSQDVAPLSDVVGDQIPEAPPADVEPTPEPTKEQIEANATAFAKQAMSYPDGAEVEIGDHVRFRRVQVQTARFAPESDEFLSASPIADADTVWDVVSVNDPREHEGYAVGLMAPSPFPQGHDLEGVVSASEAEVTVEDGTRYGRGWWALGSELEKVDAPA